jgi:hypothetical protein
MAFHLVRLEKVFNFGVQPKKTERDGLGVRHASQGEEGVRLMLANPL